VLEDLDVEGVAGALGRSGPELGHGDPDAVEGDGRALAAIGERLRVAEGAADALDPADAAAHIPGRADMAGPVALADADDLSGRETRRARRVRRRNGPWIDGGGIGGGGIGWTARGWACAQPVMVSAGLSHVGSSRARLAQVSGPAIPSASRPF